MNTIEIQESFQFENGKVLPGLTIAYHTYGKLNEAKDNVVWVCHALTANSDVFDWWPGIVGENCVINPKDHFIVCVNIIGSCYGSSGPLTINPETQQPYYSSFPVVTIRDMINSFILIRKKLGIEKIKLLMGGSMGGYQVLEWCLIEPDVIQNSFVITASAAESAWGIAIHTAQRLAIEADQTWQDKSIDAGKNGIKAARGIGMLTYRNYKIFHQRQTDPDFSKTDNYKASSYILHQGNKLSDRFNAQSYWLLTKSMDSHNIARGRFATLEEALKEIHQPMLVIGIDSDILCPLAEQKFLADHLPNSTLHIISSDYGHDGFLVETETISRHLFEWMEKHGL
ncbi:MAG TPA: homoserine O-acetyltransferase [Chitinophagaceae bacterium]|nr:homoserine O-acetyltransferase [Chitinophagaceae bacterium]